MGGHAWPSYLSMAVMDVIRTITANTHTDGKCSHVAQGLPHIYNISKYLLFFYRGSFTIPTYLISILIQMFIHMNLENVLTTVYLLN